MKKGICLFFLSTLFFAINPFNSIPEINNFLADKKEYPKPDNDDLLHPDYTSFHKQHTPGTPQRLFDKALNFLKLKKQIWSIEKLEELLSQITKERINKGYKEKFIFKITPTEKTNFIIWGDLQGSIHSLERTLEKLKKDKYIDDDLKIIKPNSFLIFNGNIISRSPYILETLTLVLNILEKNPDKAIWIKGEHESKENWRNFGLEEEIKIRAQNTDILINKLNAFLNTLPLALYIRISPEHSDFIRISYFNRNYTLLNESTFANFLNENTGNILDTFNLATKEKSLGSVNISAIIKGREYEHLYKKTEGLQQLLPDKGARAWSILSCPNRTFQQIYEFRNDSFTLVEVNPKNQQAIITLYKQDAVKQEGFSAMTYDLITGEETTRNAIKAIPAQTVAAPTIASQPIIEAQPKVEIQPQKKIVKPKIEQPVTPPQKQKLLKLGNTIYASGSEALVAKQVLDGTFLCINNENKTSPIRTTLTSLDDKYDPKIARDNIEQLLKQGINKIFHPAGSILLEGYLDLIRDGKVFVFSGASSPNLRFPDIKNLIHYVPSADQSAKLILEYAITELKLNKFAIVYETETWSEGALKGALETLNEYKKKTGNVEWITISMVPNTLDPATLKSVAQKIKDFNPEAIVHFPPNPQLQALIRQLDLSFLVGKTILGIESNVERKKIVREKGLKYAGVQNVPDPETSDIEIVKEYRALAQKAGQKLNESSLEPYMGIAILLDIAKKIPGEITKDSIINAAEQIKNYNFKGLYLNFDPKTRCLRNSVWIDTGEDKITLYKPKTKIPPALPATAATAQPVQYDKEIIVGSTMDLSGKVLGADSKEIELGLRAVIDKQNSQNGINGKKIKLVILDDQFSPEKAKENIEKLISEYKTDIILSPVGSHPFSGIAPLILEKKIAVFIPNVGSSLYRKPEYTNLINFYGSAYDEGKALIDYLINKSQITRFIIFTEKESYSEDALRGAKEAFEKNNFKENINYKIISQPISKKDQFLPHQVNEIIKQIKEFNPDAIGFLSLGSITQPIFLGFNPVYLESKTLFGISSLISIKKLARNRNIPYISTLSVPDPIKNTDLEIVKMAQDDLNAKGYTINSGSMEGYIAAAIFINLLKKVTGNITKEKLIEVATKIKDEDFYGLKLNFDPQTRSLSKGIWLDPGTRPPFLYNSIQPEKKLPKKDTVLK